MKKIDFTRTGKGMVISTMPTIFAENTQFIVKITDASKLEASEYNQERLQLTCAVAHGTHKGAEFNIKLDLETEKGAGKLLSIFDCCASSQFFEDYNEDKISIDSNFNRYINKNKELLATLAVYELNKRKGNFIKKLSLYNEDDIKEAVILEIDSNFTKKTETVQEDDSHLFVI